MIRATGVAYVVIKNPAFLVTKFHLVTPSILREISFRAACRQREGQ